MRRRFLLVLGVACTLLTAPFLLLAAHFHKSGWWFDAGIMVGAAMAFWMIAKDSPPEHIERMRTGYQGEQMTAKALKRLPAGWTVLHDLDAGRRGNLDHIAVGPGGVFLLDSKWFVGETTVETGIVRVRRYEDAELTYIAEGLPQRMRSLARHVHDEVREKVRMSVWVTPVVVLWGGYEAQVEEVEGVAYIHGERLNDWLRSRPTRLPPQATARVTAALDESAAGDDRSRRSVHATRGGN